MSTATHSRPEWLKARFPGGPNYHELKVLTNNLRLHTVCESARCPNIGECWDQRTATFMILGDVCTRRCGFCAVPKGAPLPVDYEEPERVAQAVQRLGLLYAVVTSVNRDDRKDGGAEIFALTIEAIRRIRPECKVEVLIPDFQGSRDALATVLAARPDVLDHNTETVPRLYSVVRPGARFERSLELIARVRGMAPEIATKSGLMLGLGEDTGEVLDAMRSLVAHGCQILTLGQYLRPSMDHLPIARYYTPQEFTDLKREGEAMGFRHVESGPLVRSSYHARTQLQESENKK
jgi:lipoic acid synthetase